MQFWEENNIEKNFVKPVLFRVQRDYLASQDELEYSFEKILDFDHNFFITGAPGSGKTLLLKYIEYISKNSKEFMSIFISLREIHNMNISSIEISQKEKRIVFLLDGLDEVPGNIRNETKRQIEELKFKYTKACFIITSRLLANHEIAFLKEFIVLRISELNDLQLADLFRTHGITDWRRAYSTIQSSVALRGVIRNPFMAKLVIQYFDVIESNDYIVDPTLYINRLVSEYVYKASQSVGISDIAIDRLIREIAAFLHYKDTQCLSVRDIHALSNNYLGTYNRDFKPDLFLDEMLRGYIFREVSPDLYSFAHRTIFEHFLTKHLRNLVGYHGSKLIFDTRQSVITAIKLKGLKEREKLKNVLLGIELDLGLSNSQVTTVYAREGSLEILLALAMGGAVIHAFKKFSDGFFTKLGHITAERSISNKESIALPEEITGNLPPWIRDNKEAMKIFTNELIVQHARDSIENDKAIVSIAINSVLTAQYRGCYERISLSQFNDTRSQSTEGNTRKG